MSQKPANSRGLTAEALATTGDSGTADGAGDPRESGAPASPMAGRRLSPTGPQATARPQGNAVAAHAHPRAAAVARAATGPVRAVAANDDMPSIGGLIFA